MSSPIASARACSTENPRSSRFADPSSCRCREVLRLGVGPVRQALRREHEDARLGSVLDRRAFHHPLHPLSLRWRHEGPRDRCRVLAFHLVSAAEDSHVLLLNVGQPQRLRRCTPPLRGRSSKLNRRLACSWSSGGCWWNLTFSSQCSSVREGVAQRVACCCPHGRAVARASATVTLDLTTLAAWS